MGKYKVIDGQGVIPEGTLYIDELAFLNNKELKRIRIPESVSEIGDDAFKGCSNLLIVHIPNNTCLREIGYHAFEDIAILIYNPKRSRSDKGKHVL